MSYNVCVIACPYCGHEKAISNLKNRCIVTFSCKSCRKQSVARKNQECFEFQEIEEESLDKV